MKILITTGTFPPEAGGPATYAPKLAEGLAKRGHDVSVVALSDSSYEPADDTYTFSIRRIARRGKVSNYLRFFWITFWQMRQVDITYSLNFFSYGFLTALAARLWRVRYVVRVGGDYLWEQFYLGSNPPLSLKEFYKQRLYQRYPLAFRLVRWQLRGAARVVFNSDVQAEMYRWAYNLSADNTAVVYNPTPTIDKIEMAETNKKEIIFAGRINPMKNVEALVRAFKVASLPEYRLVVIGSGPLEEHVRRLVVELDLDDWVEFIPRLPQVEMWERVANARLVVLPSWTDISPNFAFECLVLGVPLVITQENYLPFREQIPHQINPASVEGIASTLKLLAIDEAAYGKYAQALQQISFSQSWNDTVERHIKLFEEII